MDNTKRSTRSTSASSQSPISEELQKYFESQAFFTILKKAVGSVLEEEVKVIIREEFATKLEPLEKRLNDLEEKVKVLEAMASEVKYAATKANDNEQYSRRYNLRIVGMKESDQSENGDGTKESDQREDCVSLITTFCKDKLALTLDPNDIDRAHRVGRKDPEKPRAILVKFKSYNQSVSTIILTGSQ